MVQPDPIENALWSTDVDPKNYPGNQYHEHLLEQYKLYVEMADRISQRRHAANTFFVVFNTAIIGALAVLFKDVPQEARIAFFIATAVMSLVWFVLLRSYRNLNTAKYQVIGLMEKRLPSSPYYSAEWKALGEGCDWRRYIPLTKLEIYVPLIFFGLYLYLGLAGIFGNG